MTRTNLEADGGGARSWPETGGHMAGRIRRFDWSATPLGAKRSWPESLKGGVETMLTAAFPAALVWGSRLTVFFNDAWRRQIGGEECLGRAADDDIGPPWTGLSRSLSEALRKGKAASISQKQDAPRFRIVPVFSEDGAPAGLSIRPGAPDERDDWLEFALDDGNLAIWDWDIGADTVVWSDALYRIAAVNLGEVETTPRFGASLLHPDDRRETLRSVEAARARGETLHAAFRIVRRDGSIRCCTTRARVLRDAAGEATRMIGILEDTTELANAQRRQRLLRSELQHRVRNTLGVIRSIVRRTADSAESVEDFAAHLEGRIGALARLQTLMSQHPETGVSLETLLREELREAVAETGRASLCGPEVNLPTRAAEAMSLALHELTANALKFGALSEPDGRLEVEWSLERGELTLHWRERGVSVPAQPPQRGFGTDVIEERLPYELGADVSYRLDADGVSCTIRFALPE